MVTPQDNDDPSIKRTFANWLFGQESNTVALYLILIAMGYGGWWSITVGIPLHLKQIQDGYREEGDRNRTFQKDLAERTHEDIEKLSSSFERAVEKNERAFQAGFDAARKRSVGSPAE